MKSKARILHISQSAEAGVKTHLIMLLKHSDRSKYEMSLISSPYGTLSEEAARLRVKVYEVEMVREFSPMEDIKALLKIVKIMCSNNFDLVHVHSTKAGFLGRIAAKMVGLPCVYTPNAYLYLSYTGLRRCLYLTYERFMKPLTNILAAVSASEQERSTSDVRYPRRKLRLLPNSIEVDPEACFLRRDTTTNGPQVLMVGRLAYQKNPEMFIRVARLVKDEVPNVKFIFLGARQSDELVATVEKLISELELDKHLEMLGWVTRSEVARLTTSCSIFVMTSRYEGLPYAPLEAMALKKPIVATNVDGLRDLVLDGETGYLADVDDDSTMAQYILKLLGNEKLREQMGEAGYKRVNNCFRIGKNIGKLLAIYDELICAER